MAGDGFGAEVTQRSLDGWERHMFALTIRVHRRTDVAVRKGMRVVERRVKRYLRTYTHPEGTPTPSPPGGPPALVTGNLMRSWRTKGPRQRGPNVVEMEGGPTAKYSRIQELGGRAGHRHRTTLPKRPYVRPMVLVTRREVRTIFFEEWSRALML